MTLDDDRPGRVVALNGGSSAGKTTVGRALQSSLAGPWLLLGIDLFLWTLPPSMLADPAGLTIRDGVIARGESFRRLYAGFRTGVGALARSGVDVLLDDVLLDGAADQRDWEHALHDVDVCWVAVRCAPELAAAREAERGDRPSGIARQQANAVHEGVRYDLEVDTGVLGLGASVSMIADELHRRWSVPRSTASDDAPTGRATSPRTGPSGLGPAPWER